MAAASKSPIYTRSPLPHPSRQPVLSPRVVRHSVSSTPQIVRYSISASTTHSQSTTPAPSTSTTRYLADVGVVPVSNKLGTVLGGLSIIVVVGTMAATILWCRKARYRRPAPPADEPRLPLYTPSLSRTSSASSFNPAADNWPRSRFPNQSVKGCNSPV